MKYLYVLLTLVLTTNINAQVFEALDHHSLGNETVKVIPYDLGLILIQREKRLGLIHINYLNGDGEILPLHTIDKEYIVLRPKGIISNLETDGSITIYLSNMWEFDIYTSSIFKINFNGKNCSLEELNNSQNVDIADIAFVDGQIHLLTHWRDAMYKIENDIPIVIRNNFSFNKFHQKTNGDLYCFKTDSIVKFDGGFVYEAEEDFEIHDIIEDKDSNNIILGWDRIKKYNADFTQLIWEYDFPTGLFSISTLNKNENDIYFGVRDSLDIYSIWRANDNGIELYQDSQNSSTQLHSIYFVDGFQYLIGVSETDLSTNTLINKLSVNGEREEDYDFIDLELENVYAERREFVANLPRPWDSTFNYDLNFTVKNNSTDTIKYFNLFLEYSDGFISPVNNAELELDVKIAPGEREPIERTLAWAKRRLQPIKFIIPGANYKRDLDLSNNSKEVTVVINANKTIVSYPIDVFPNPVQNTLNLVIPAEEGLKKFAVYDFKGQKVMEGDLTSSDLVVSNLINGIYLLRLVSQNGKLFYSKFTKH